jgi:hypothetical protein
MASIDEYCNLVHQGANFNEVRLAELREHMSPEEVERVCVRLKREANAGLEAADTLSEWNLPRRFPDAIIVDNYFGGCPECGKTDGHLNVGRDHWFVCHAHKKCWSPGSNLFSSWKDETEAEWKANFALLNGYDEVAPLLEGRWPRNPEAQAIVRAERERALVDEHRARVSRAWNCLVEATEDELPF